ncbi:MAG: EAL domain-containing protein [Nevskia sp.]|nr:EAL domain-containing protein [Nevskia sp.]
MTHLPPSPLDAILNPRIKEIVDAIPVALFVKDSHSRFVLMNRACEEQFGLSFADLRGSDGSGFFPAEQVEAFLAKDREVFAGRRPVDYQETIRNAALKQNRVGHTIKHPVYDADGSPLYLVGVTVDVTERVGAEAEPRISDDKLRRLFEVSPMGIALTDMAGRYLDFNQAFERICGYSREELNRLDYWALTPKEYAEQEEEQLASLSARGSYGPYEKEYIRKDGGRVPLRLNGVLIHDSEGRPYIWSIVEDITERKKKDELIWLQANFDMVTNLPNRRLFRDRLEQEIKKAQRHGLQVALLYIDLDHFKDINDTFGHDKGDLLLAEAARRISSCVRTSDTVARPGGDEFVVILPQFGGLATVERLARGILEALHAPFDLNGDHGYVSASIGITIYPDDARNLEGLLIHVDQAMYLAKSQGRDRFAYFTESMQREAEQKRALTNDLRQALARNELELYYQPIIDSASGRIVKAEALLRWKHPQRGMVSPAEFIPLAEGSWLIFDIGRWALEQAIAVAERFRRQGRAIEISVNMSALQLSDPSHNGWLEELRGLPPNSLAIEITESTLLRDSITVKQRLLELRNLGIQVSIDDFGMGFSALSSLKKFHIDYLKIDRAFTSGLLEDESDRALTEAIIVMAHKLGIKTIAEGVETEAQREVLLRLGSDYLQGFLFSPGLPVAEFERMLRDDGGTNG